MKDEEKNKEQLIAELQKLRLHISELKQSEITWKATEKAFWQSKEEYKALIDAMHDTVWIIDFDGNIIDANRTAVETLGYSHKELSSMHITDIDLGLDKSAEKRIKKGIQSNKRQTFETVHTTKDGKQIPMEVQVTPIRYPDKNATLSIAKDITERKQTEEELLKLRKLESVGVLAGGIAHDFNNLLTAIFGNIEMGKMSLPADHKAYKFLDQAGQSLETATKLTKQLLTFAKGGDPIMETLSICDVLIEAAQFSLRGSNTKLKTSINPDLWPVEADKGQLSQVISNIVLNAQQAMPEGGIINLGAENIQLSGKKYINITIKDRGVGIAPQHLNRIFDPYFTTQHKGSGLGLATAHSIIKKHKGTISVDSKLNQGTKLTIRLPAAEVVEETNSEQSENINDYNFVSTPHSLVLDDEKTIRDLLGTMLERLGHTVTYAIDGQEAIEKYQEAYLNGPVFDVIIMDLTIPGGMGGQTAAQEILKINPKAKIIVSSGYTTDPVMANYHAHGFQGIMAKPYRFAELKKVIQQVLEN